ncbi:DUF4097 family beta strand repeat-containing protein [Streptomyces termitum]|uniref:DUF4097 family beta strand repeat-containing protein n=1 Tax=Streptomyces termitum TaxID=67368 RepID=UPI0033B1FC7D
MRRRPHRLVVLAAAGLTTAGLAACGPLMSSTFEDDGTLGEKITSVRLENGSGGVTLNGRSGGGSPSLHREVQYRGDRPEGASHRIEDGVLVLRGCGDRCSVHYTVDLPAGLPVTGGVSNGDVRLNEVGAVRITSGNGRIELDGVTGTVDVRSSNGRITGRNIKGPRIEAHTTNGDVTLAPATPADVRAGSSNGTISVTVPKARYRVTATTDNGQKDIGVPTDPAGTYALDLTSDNGDITAKHS